MSSYNVSIISLIIWGGSVQFKNTVNICHFKGMIRTMCVYASVNKSHKKPEPAVIH